MWEFLIYAAISIAISIGMELLRPKPKVDSRAPSSLGDFSLPTATEGRPIPVVWGTCLVRGSNVLWYGNLRTLALSQSVSTGWFSSTDVVTGYVYYLTMHIAICWGPLYPDLFEVRFGDKIFTQYVYLDGSSRPIGVRVHPTQPPSSDVRLLSGSVAKDSWMTWGDIDIYGGVFPGQFSAWWPAHVANAYLASAVGSPVSAYRGLAHVVLKDFQVGDSAYIDPIAFVVRRMPPIDPSVDDYENVDGIGANPAGMIRECLTDTVWGLATDIGQIDIDSFNVARDMLRDEGFGLSMTMDGGTPAGDMINEILRHIDGVLYTDPETGLLTLRVIRLGYLSTGYDRAGYIELDLNPDNVSSCEMSRGSWAETKNVVKVNYVDVAQNFTVRTAQAQDLANIQIRGGEIAAETYDFKGIYSPSVADAVAVRILRSVSTPLARVSIVANRAAWKLRPGSAFSLAWPDLGIDDLHFRVLKISYGLLAEGKISIEAVEDVFTSPRWGVSAPNPGGTDPIPAIGALWYEAMIEAPYHMTAEAVRNIIGLGVRSTPMDTGFQAWVDEDGGSAYAQANSLSVIPGGTLDAEYQKETAAYDTTGFVVTSVAMLETLASVGSVDYAKGLSLLKIDDEIMAWKTVTNLGGGKYRISNITRGVIDTVPAEHAVGGKVIFLPAAPQLVKDTDYPADFTMTAKFLPFNGTNVFPLTAALQLTLVTDSRAWKPYPPGNVELNGMKWYTSGFASEDDVVLAWAHRHRVDQTAVPEVVDQDAGDYSGSPEGNYTVKVYADGVLVQTYSAISGTTQTYSQAQRISDDPAAIRFDFHLIPVNGALEGTDRVMTTWISGFGLAFGAGFGVGNTSS